MANRRLALLKNSWSPLWAWCLKTWQKGIFNILLVWLLTVNKGFFFLTTLGVCSSFMRYEVDTICQCMKDYFYTPVSWQCHLWDWSHYQLYLFRVPLPTLDFKAPQSNRKRCVKSVICIQDETWVASFFPSRIIFMGWFKTLFTAVDWTAAWPDR